MALLTPADFPAIRASLDVVLTAALLPDATIALPVYQAAGEAQVLARDPDAAGRTGAEGERVKRAAVAFVAALLAPAVPRLVQEAEPNYSYKADRPAWSELAHLLTARANGELNAYLTTAQPPLPLPTLFTIARAGR